jgi:hypothetical protein
MEYGEGTYRKVGKKFISTTHTHGYYVATTDNKVADSLEEITREHLVATQLSSSDYIGVFYDDKVGKVCVDRVVWVEHGQLAHAIATQFKQRSIYSLASQKVLPTIPTSWEALSALPTQ